ncbi:spore protein [Paenibacillus darwinianus]|uniref:Spore protein n=1 Tax=Paenibacillus darwinianus TaxID=1380763 RepID=A0A9W5S1B0_9BACL|nr:GerW family sporulation protein [Paenibacillus darwinianus]EXX88254.1 spore protein [Paenibacillus darwinianus]EXX88581.1 spore protein [Paenibacillus darwinianus]EXX91772.1 spore protein [Paenibacillus darwinianus]
MMEHPIQGLMETAMESIKEMVDVNTIVGDPVQTPDGSVIMPISKVGFGFVAGGSDIRFDGSGGTSATIEEHNASVSLPFGGGSGGGVSITPIAFLVVGSHGVKIVSLDNSTHLWERMIDSAPKVVDKLQSMLKGGANAGTSTMFQTSGTAGLNGGTGMAGATGAAGMSGAGTTGAGATGNGTGSSGSGNFI